MQKFMSKSVQSLLGVVNFLPKMSLSCQHFGSKSLWAQVRLCVLRREENQEILQQIGGSGTKGEGERTCPKRGPCAELHLLPTAPQGAAIAEGRHCHSQIMATAIAGELSMHSYCTHLAMSSS